MRREALLALTTHACDLAEELSLKYVVRRVQLLALVVRYENRYRLMESVKRLLTVSFANCGSARE